MKIRTLWDPLLCGPIPPGVENKPLGALKLTKRRYERALEEYRERQAEIALEVKGG